MNIKNLHFAENTINFLFFVIGIVSLWIASHNWTYLWWAFVASLHISLVRFVTEKEKDDKKTN